MQTKELRAVMVLNGDSQKDLAAVLDITQPTMSDKINGRAVFKQNEIEIIALRYKLSADDIQRIFFAKTVN